MASTGHSKYFIKSVSECSVTEILTVPPPPPRTNFYYLMMDLYFESQGFNVELCHGVIQFSCVDRLYFFFQSFNFTFAALFHFHTRQQLALFSALLLAVFYLSAMFHLIHIISKLNNFLFSILFLICKAFISLVSFCSISTLFYLTGSNSFQKLIPLL